MNKEKSDELIEMLKTIIEEYENDSLVFDDESNWAWKRDFVVVNVRSSGTVERSPDGHIFMKLNLFCAHVDRSVTPDGVYSERDKKYLGERYVIKSRFAVEKR